MKRQIFLYSGAMSHIQKRWLTALGIFLILGVGSAIALKRHDIIRSVERASLPAPVTYEEVPQATPTTAKAPAGKVAPAPTVTPAPAAAKEVNLAVPFTPQAPYANWDDPYGEFCEEASVLMAISYINGEPIPTPEDADAKLLAIKAFEAKRFGYYQDTTAAETAIILKEFYKYNHVQLIDNPTVAGIKVALSGGKLIIVPMAGRMLGNPYFQTPGPLYHMLVIKGYTADGKFITNDPGTRRGADFLYSEKTIMDALHDWHGDVHIELGKKVIIVVG